MSWVTEGRKSRYFVDKDGDRQMVVVSIEGWPARQLTECVLEFYPE